MEKEKKILSRKSINTTIIVFICIILIYIFFFTSKWLLPANITSESSTPQIGKEIQFGNDREYNLISVAYSKEDQEMEIVMSLTNNSYDNVNEYYTAVNVLGGSSKKVEIKEIMNQSLLTVFRIENLKSFDEITFMLAPKIADINEVKDEDTAFIALNKYNITEVSHIKDKSKEEYMTDRLEMMIADFKSKIETEENKLDELNNKVKSLEKENEDYSKNEKFLTSEEQTEARIKIETNKQNIETTKTEIANQQKIINQLKVELEESENRLEALK